MHLILIRLAKEYLGHVQSGYDSEGSDFSVGIDGKDFDSGVVSDRLRKERLEAQGKYFKSLSSTISSLDIEKDIEKRTMSGHQVSFNGHGCILHNCFHITIRMIPLSKIITYMYSNL